jgi:hypothetical protein
MFTKLLSCFFIVHVDVYLQGRTLGAWVHQAGHRLAAFDPTDWALDRHSETKTEIRQNTYTLDQYELGPAPTAATRLRFDQEKSRLHLIHGESSSHHGRAGGRSAITN